MRVRIDLTALRQAATEKLGVDITTIDAAERVLVSHRSWLRWENEGKTIPAAVVRRFCAVTGLVARDWLPE